MKEFSSFSPNFLQNLMIFQNGELPNMRQNSEKSSNIKRIVGKWRKSCNFSCYFNGHVWNQKCLYCIYVFLLFNFILSGTCTSCIPQLRAIWLPKFLKTGALFACNKTILLNSLSASHTSSNFWPGIHRRKSNYLPPPPLDF